MTSREVRPTGTRRRGFQILDARLPVYHRVLCGLGERGVATVSSEELAASSGVNSAKLRKDLSHLGSYGTRGVGYDVSELIEHIGRSLGLTQDWAVVIVGVGNLGHALANYGGFRTRGFRVVALVDADPARFGERRRPRHPPAGRPRDARRRPGREHRGRRHPGECRAGRLRPPGGCRRHEHPQLRAARAVRPPRGRRTQGGPRPELQILAFHQQRKSDLVAALP